MFALQPSTALNVLLLIATPFFSTEGSDVAREQLGLIRAGMKARIQRDELRRDDSTQQVVSAIDTLASNFSTFDDKTQREVVKGVAGVLSVWMEEEDCDIHFASAAALSDMGSYGASALRNARGINHLQINVNVHRIVIEALGKYHDVKDLPYFFKLLDDDDVRIVGSAATALGEYSDADSETRKRIARGLIKPYLMAHRMNEKKKGEDKRWRDRLIGIEVPINTALDRMTAQNLQSAPEWDAWLKKHLTEDW